MWSDTDFARVGQAIRELRLRRGWTQDELAKKVGMRRASISEIEGGRQPFPSTLDRIADALGTTSTALLLAGAGPLPEALEEACASGLIRDVTFEEIMRLRMADALLGRTPEPIDYASLLAIMRRKPARP